MEKVTVVIPNYNGKKYLNDCLLSLYAQEKDKGEFCVLVVDNGSTDGSVELAKEKFPQTSWILLKENTGFCHAVNEGIKAATTPYVILLNNDTKVYDGFVHALYQAMEKSPNTFSVSAQMLQWNQPDRLDNAGDLYCVFGWAYARGKGRDAKDFHKETSVFSACGGAAIYRREIFNQIGYFDELHFAYLEDVDIGYRAKIYGYQNKYEPKARVLHYGSASTGSTYNEKKTKLASANNIYLVWKNMPLLQLLWNLPFLLLGFFIKYSFFCRKKMGILYLKSLCNGWKRCFTAQGRKQKVPFLWKNFKNYFRIQGALYVNVLRIIMKY